MNLQAHSFLSALDGLSGQKHASVTLPERRDHSTRWMGLYTAEKKALESFD